MQIKRKLAQHSHKVRGSSLKANIPKSQTEKSNAMLSIKILGPGCANCNRLDQLARQALERLGLEAEVVKLSDPAKFADYDVMTTPGLVINDETVCSGRVPSMSELSGFINAALAAG